MAIICFSFFIAVTGPSLLAAFSACVVWLGHKLIAIRLHRDPDADRYTK